MDAGGSTLNNRSTLFRCSNGVIIQDLVCDGMGGYTPGSPASDPTAATLGGVYFALNGAASISDKSPYIYNVTTFGDGATGAVVDGSLHAGGNRSMLFHTVTHIHGDGLDVGQKIIQTVKLFLDSLIIVLLVIVQLVDLRLDL